MSQYKPAPEGDSSPGVALGGLKGQFLRKASDLDYDTDWEDISGLVGPAGPAGPAGPTGATGATGATGPAGVVAATAPIAYDSGTQTVSTSMATGKLLGRSTAGTGVAEEITVGSGLSLSSGTLSSTSGGSFTGGTLTSNLTLAAGTTSLSPLTLQSGTNLTTATAGVVEYDGKVIYTTPAARGVSPSMMFYRLNSNYAGSNATGVQPLLGVGVTVNASTVYAFESQFTIQKTSGTTSHTIGISFGGTATTNNISYFATSVRFDTAGTSGGSSTGSGFSTVVAYNTTTSNVVMTGAATTANHTFTCLVRGTVSINAGGTFIPRYQLSAAPGGAYSTLAGSAFYIWPIGASGADTSIGPWA